jgi:4-hydroxy-tetrahydrodipicolinate synthase
MPFRGVFAIPVTPFDDRGAIDFASLASCVEFCVEAGAHGVVLPVNASEFFTLSDAERMQVVKCGVEAAAGAVPVVAGVSGVSPQHALEMASRARDVGADALIALPPTSRQASQPQIEEYFRALGEGVDLPLFLQDHDPPAGTRISVDVMVRLLREVPSIKYVKEETMPPGPVITAVLEQAGKACLGVMGGMGGRYLIDEFRRGACGTMPGCHITDVHAALWSALESGDMTSAREIHTRMLPSLVFEAAYGVAAYKEVLRRRGVIRSAHMRVPARRTFDRYDLQELDEVMAGLSDLMTWRKGGR